MSRILKYRLTPDHPCHVTMPQGAQLLHAGAQDGAVFVWALVRGENVAEDRRFHVYGTGHTIDQADLIHVGTLQMQNGLVWHVFEELRTHRSGMRVDGRPTV